MTTLQGTSRELLVNLKTANGDVAPMVERLLCKQDVEGSNPFISTQEKGGVNMNILLTIVVIVVIVWLVSLIV